MSAYKIETKRLDALAEAMALVSEEFTRTREPEVAAAGHVLSELIIRQLKAVDRQIDKLVEKAGI